MTTHHDENTKLPDFQRQLDTFTECMLSCERKETETGFKPDRTHFCRPGFVLVACACEKGASATVCPTTAVLHTLACVVCLLTCMLSLECSSQHHTVLLLLVEPRDEPSYGVTLIASSDPRSVTACMDGTQHSC